MKFIHCADLHLESKMESNLDPEKARLRRDELLDTYEEMVKYADANQVRAILIAGDLFDKLHIRKVAKSRVVDVIREYSHIDFLYLKGNHDKNDFLQDVDELPANLKLFGSDEWTSYEYDNVVISGREINKENSKVVATNLVLDQSKVNIVMLHGQESNYEGPDHTEIINLSEFKNKNIDYLALGHIHVFKLDRLDDRGLYCYSGCLEGRGFDECDEKGFVLLDIDEDKVNYEFVPFAKRMLHEVHVEVNPEMSMPEIMAAINEAIDMINVDDMVKVILEGKTEMNFDVDVSRIVRLLESRFFFGKVYDLTSVNIRYEDFANDPSLKGEFIRLMQGQDMSEEERSEIIEIGIKAIMGEEILE